MRKMKAPFNCSFKATGKGYVLCERWDNINNCPAQPIHYKRDDIRPATSALTQRQRREYRAAIKEEWGEGNG